MSNVSLPSIFNEIRRALDDGEADLAVGMAQHLIQHAPDVIEGHRLLGEAELNAGRFEPAIAAFEAVLRADPENIAAYYGRGLAEQSLDRSMDAIRSFERALEIQPNLAELRTQLLRLYAETPNSAGQFRLSRSGLGRLYARGQMYSQAIDEFRAVLDTDPTRDDLRVALAEALWRDGQEDEAVAWCQVAVEQRPELHKPTLILGYLQLAAGRPEGEALWRRAAAQEPTLATAQALFDILPPIHVEEILVPAFDREAWQAEQERRRNPQPVEVTPLPATVADDNRAAVADVEDNRLPAIADVEAGSLLAAVDAGDESVVAGAGLDDDDFSDDDYLPDDVVAVTSPDATPAAAREPDQHELSDEDLLASLLGFGDDTFESGPALPAEPPGPPIARARSHVAMTYDVAGVRAGGPEVAEPTLDDTPASFDDWQIEDAPGDETAQRSAGGTASMPIEGEVVGNPRTTIRLNDEDAGADIQPMPLDAAAQPARTTGLGRVEPFTLDDWNFEPLDEPADEDVAPAGGASEAKPDTSQDDLEPFFVDDLSRGDAERQPRADLVTASAATPAPETEMATGVLDADDTAPVASSYDVTGDDGPARRAADTGEDGIFSTRNFVPDDDELDDPRRTEQLGSAHTGAAGDDEAQAPFSLRDLGLDDDEPALESEGLAGTTANVASLEDVEAQPAAAQTTAPARSTHDEGADAGPGAPVETALEEDSSPFSLADLGLSDEELAEWEAQADVETPGWSEGARASFSTGAESLEDTTPFSLADLGLSDEEIDLFALEDDEDATTLRTEDRSQGDADQPAAGAGTASEESTEPFPWAEFGLSEDDVAALAEATDEAGAAPAAGVPIHEAETQPFDIAAITSGGATPQIVDAGGDDGDARTTTLSSGGSSPASELEPFYAQLEQQPENHGLRLALARMSEQKGDTERALEQYRLLIRHGGLLDPVVDDLREMTAGGYDRALLRRIHRLLGDAYMRQDRMAEAMHEYSWT